MFRRIVWYTCLVFASLPIYAVDPAALPFAAPEQLGFSADRLNFIDTYYEEKVRNGEIAGIVTLVARHGKIAHFSAVGYADLGTKRKMEKDTIFRLYSQTKPVAATALMMLYEEGKFQLDDPISKYLPEFKGVKVLRTPDSPVTDTVPATREPTIHDLFRHTAGLEHGTTSDNPLDAAYADAKLLSPDVPIVEVVQRLAKLPLHHQPGTTWEYSLSQDVQARLVEVMSGMAFDSFLKKRLFDPLGMKDTGYLLSAEQAKRISAVHWSKQGKLVPCDKKNGCFKPSVYLFEEKDINGYTVDVARKGGSYGLYSTAEDYWRFAQMMLDGGIFAGKRYLAPATVHYMASDHLSPVEYPLGKGQSWGLGFCITVDSAKSGVIGNAGSFYWGGAANTSFWIDPKEDLIVVAMTQLMEAPQVPVWGQLSALVYGALEQ